MTSGVPSNTAAVRMAAAKASPAAICDMPFPRSAYSRSHAMRFSYSSCVSWTALSSIATIAFMSFIISSPCDGVSVVGVNKDTITGGFFKLPGGRGK